MENISSSKTPKFASTWPASYETIINGLLEFTSRNEEYPTLKTLTREDLDAKVRKHMINHNRNTTVEHGEYAKEFRKFYAAQFMAKGTVPDSWKDASKAQFLAKNPYEDGVRKRERAPREPINVRARGRTANTAPPTDPERSTPPPAAAATGTEFGFEAVRDATEEGSGPGVVEEDRVVAVETLVELLSTRKRNRDDAVQPAKQHAVRYGHAHA
jgi:hypothetical protein